MLLLVGTYVPLEEGGECMSDILHCDLNNFFASVECRDNPNLSGKPVAVCGSVADRHGIVLAKNYLAKEYGIKTAESVYEALNKCPHLTIVEPHMDRYAEISREVQKIYSEYTDMVEPFGIDECWLDVTGSHYLFGSSEEIAYKIKEDVKRRLGLTISVGVSFTKVLAKLGSDMKKPDAVTVLSKDSYRDKIKNLPAGDLIGVGASTTRRLAKLRIRTIGDLINSDPDTLSRLLGKNGLWLWQAVNGYDNEEVQKIELAPPRKSAGASTTLPYDLENNSQVWQMLLLLSEEVCETLRGDQLYAGGVCIITKTNNFEYREYQRQLEYPHCSALILAEEGFKLFKERYDWHMPLRSIGIKGINLVSSDIRRQSSFFADTDRIDNFEKLDYLCDNLKSKYGRSIVLPARLYK